MPDNDDRDPRSELVGVGPGESGSPITHSAEFLTAGVEERHGGRPTLESQGDYDARVAQATRQYDIVSGRLQD